MSQRKQRVEHGLRDVLTEMIARDVKDPRVRAATLITVTKVELNVAHVALGFSFFANQLFNLYRFITEIFGAHHVHASFPIRLDHIMREHSIKNFSFQFSTVPF